MNTLCKTINSALAEDHYTINGFAKKLDIQQSSLQRFCAGQQGIQFDSLLKICDILNLRLARIMSDEEFRDYCRDVWDDREKEEVEGDFYERKSEEWREYAEEAWKEFSKDAWNKYSEQEWKVFAKANHLDDKDSEERQCWEEEEYPEWKSEEYPEWEEMEYQEWSEEYDRDNYREWENEAFKEFVENERERLQKEDWFVILPE